ncbi:hypothetical protein [Streptomyces sp. DSM 41013]
MDSFRSIHARVGGLARHRPANDPELAAARLELARRKAEVREARARMTSLPMDVCERILSNSGAQASV